MNRTTHRRCQSCGEDVPPMERGRRGARKLCDQCQVRRPLRESLRAYRLTLADYDRLLCRQQGRCAICSDELRQRPVVDHCHAHGHVRGILCSGCNLGLGGFLDRPAALRAAADYLERV